jgi:hypothetical protein
MKPRSRLRISIGQWTVLVAVVALLYSLPHQKTRPDSQFIAGIFALLAVLLLVGVLVDVLVGIPCPGCSRWTLLRLARARRYYCCSHCGGRYKRFFFGPWQDASGPDDDPIYRGKSRSRPWLGFAIPEDHDDTTTGALLRNHRRRRREAPAPRFAGKLILGWTSRARAWFGFTTPRDQGYTTTGLLLRNQQQRQQGPVRSAAEKRLPPDDPHR